MKRGVPKGFTLIELLVAVFVFSFVAAIATNFIFYSLNVQRRALSQQTMLDQMSYAAEYMTRALRQAKKELQNPPQCLSSRGLNYEVGSGGQRVAFVDSDGQCRAFFLSSGALQESIAGGPGIALTPSTIEVTALTFATRGEGQNDTLQPRVTFAFKARTKGVSEESQYEFQLQSTVSQRRYDASE